LLLYYCFLNLAKAYVLTVGQRQTLDRARHGISECLSPAGTELEDAYIEAKKSSAASGGRREVFDEFIKALSGQGLQANTKFDLPHLLPQALPGHRLWADIAPNTERFVSLHEVRLRESKRNRQVWLSIYLFADDLARLGLSRARVLTDSRLRALFREVQCTRKVTNRKLICFEQIIPQSYTQRASDKVAGLAAITRRFLWTIVSSVPPYRRYYLYPAPMAEHAEVLPQLASVYAVMFYLGSITRYRPHQLSSILEGQYGAFMEDFIGSQPLQFIYLMASEFAQREVTRPAIV
jgi:hypothetical protein